MTLTFVDCSQVGHAQVRSLLLLLTSRALTPFDRHRGIFSFTRTGPSSTLITVAHPTSPSKPYFRTLVRDSRATPFPLPISTSWLSLGAIKPLLAGYAPSLVQRPLPAASASAGISAGRLEELRQTGQRADAFVACPEPLRVDFAATGRVRIAVVEPAPLSDGAGPGGEGDDEGEFGDGVAFPRLRPYSRGLNFHMTSFDMDLAKGIVLKLE